MSVPVLSRALLLETPARQPDGAGGYVAGWTALGTVWAALEPRTGRDAGGEGAALALMRYRIVLRAAPEHDARARYLECFAQEEEAT
ncbi:head-tail adaptor protein [Sediminimonas qiaohouensis]|uniref:head-tail adaptor protein n=1 Tax=Sediminimonas qiaohouensis TaxID=552061 RepID=UPI000687CDB5|nr:head-tail adaptor protein [Sediminimonas qiaohouensis]